MEFNEPNLRDERLAIAQLRAKSANVNEQSTCAACLMIIYFFVKRKHLYTYYTIKYTYYKPIFCLIHRH